jgi:hypothetical protein
MREKILYFIETISFILLQIFILMRLDDEVKWSWFVVFIPWYCHDVATISFNIYPAFIEVHSPPRDEDINVSTRGGISTAEDMETGEPSTEEEKILKKVVLENEYFEKIMNQSSLKYTVAGVLCRLWLAIFLALKIDHDVSWSWGLVLLPIWSYLCLQYVMAYNLVGWGQRSINDELLRHPECIGQSPEDMDPEVSLKLSRASSVKSKVRVN